MFAVIFICENLFLPIAGKIAKLRTRKNFVPHSIYRIWVLAGRRIKTLRKEDLEVKSMTPYGRRFFLKKNYHYRT